MANQSELLTRYTEACNYPGVLDEAKVTFHLIQYVTALRTPRRIERLRYGWNVLEHPSLLRQVRAIIADFSKRAGYAARAAQAARAARDALDARAARDARAAQGARDALGAQQRFATWCVNRGSWWWHSEISWLATIYLGALQLNKLGVCSWAGPLFEAFLAGAWILYWTEDTLYWVAKPSLHTETLPSGGRRLHHASGPALESDLENLYLWHGVLVPAFAVVKPEWITLKHIQSETNAEVRRVLIERYGLSRYLLDSKAVKLCEDEFGELYKTDIQDDEPLVMVKVYNSTAEPDGSFKPYFLRVHPELRPMRKDGSLGEPQHLSPRNAVASTFGIRGEEYAQRLVEQS